MKMKKMKKIWQIILLTLFACGMGLVVFGCSDKETEETTVQEQSDNDSLTRAEFIKLLGYEFGYDCPVQEDVIFSDVSESHEYYPEIQACAESLVVDQEDKFRPDDEATIEFALNSAVKAVGIDHINESTYENKVDETDLIGFYTSNISALSTTNYSQGVDRATADAIIQYAKDFDDKLEYEQKYVMDLADGVKEALAGEFIIKGDRETASVMDPENYVVGDIVSIPESDLNTWQIIKITSIEGNTVKYVIPEMDEAIDDFEIKGTYIPEIKDAVTPDDAGFAWIGSSEENMLACMNLDNNAVEFLEVKSSNVEIDGNNIYYNTTLDEFENGEITLELAITDIKVETNIVKKDLKAEVEVKFDQEVKVTVDCSAAKSIPVGSFDMVVYGVVFKVNIYVNIGADGTATVTYSSQVKGYAEVDVNIFGKDTFRKGVDVKKQEVDFHAEITMFAKPKVKLQVWVASWQVCNMEVTTGVVAETTVDIEILGEGTEPDCIDVYVFVPLSFGINQDKCLITTWMKSAKYKTDIWTSENSPVQIRLHWEDRGEGFGLVDECTRGTEPVETPQVAEDGTPYTEYNVLDFEALDFGIIELTSKHMILEQGESLIIPIQSVPDGYELGDLQYSCDTEGLCSFTEYGLLYGETPGSGTVKISTKDGKFSTYMTVIVQAEYNDTTGFEAL